MREIIYNRVISLNRNWYFQTKNNVSLVVKEKTCVNYNYLNLTPQTVFLHLHSAMTNSNLQFDKHCNSKHNGIW